MESAGKRAAAPRRKVGLCVVLVFGIANPAIQLHTFLWVTAAALLLHCVFLPYGVRPTL